jgi:hypothetical protein
MANTVCKATSSETIGKRKESVGGKRITRS